MHKLSVVIITKNEEKNIGRCLESISEIADDVLVVDSGSTDKTEAICKELGARFMTHHWEGYAAQKNFANKKAEYPLILSIDADEALSDRLKQSINQIKEKGTADAYVMNRLTNYCGSWIRHGSWYPDRKIRIINREKFEWDGALIHEKLISKVGETVIEKIDGDLLHYSYYNIAQHIAQANHFTDLTAKLAFDRGKRANLFKLLLSPFFKFIKDYFFKLGFLDGYYGYIVCRISAQATFMKYAKLRQMVKDRKN